MSEGAEALDDEDELPLVPARMVNEVLYCERLMYLEWVQGEWADNQFTVDGTWVHRRVDRPKVLKAKGKVDEVPERPYQARSVALSSAELGVTAKIDLVDVDGDRVMPIEYKRGRAPSVPEGAYLPERAQLCVHVLLLREHGYQCEAAAIFFAAEQRRVPITIDAELERVTRDAIARASELYRQTELPPPLINSPKCRGCSLVGICLPDEVNQLKSEESVTEEPDLEQPRAKHLTEPTTALRRLHASRDEKEPLIVQEHGARVGLDAKQLKITSKDGQVSTARLAHTSHVVLYGNAQISTQATVELLRRGIPVCYFSTGGYFLGRTVANDAKNVALRVAQYQRLSDPGLKLKLASGIVRSKLLNSRTLLRRNGEDVGVALKELKRLSRKAELAESVESLLGIEGTGARTYFEAFPNVLRPQQGQTVEFDWNGRNRRPPTDPVNAMLSLCYSLLTKDMALAVTVAGLDSMFGFYHQPRHGKPALALDLMEEFRSLIADSVVITVVNTGEVQANDFIRAAGSCALSAAGRRRLIGAYERRMGQEITHPVFGYRITYRRVLEVQARLFARLIQGEITEYPEFRTR
ncbi:MAG: CRISPR-associated endonuclease Cas1 [Polyangiaceae bacterium]